MRTAASTLAMVRLLGVALVSLVASIEVVASDQPPPIATDRPSVSASSDVVPLGALQVENGTTETSTGGQRSFDAPETALRYGMWSRTELRFTVPNAIEQTDGAGSGVADLALGVKQQLVRGVRGFDASLIVSLSLPTGSSTVSSHGYDPSIQVPWSHQISANWTAGGMLSLYAPTQNGGHNLTEETTFLVDRQLTMRSDGFVEYVGDFPQMGGARHLAHVGMSFRPTPGQQLDLHIGIGLSSSAPDYLIGVGYSFRLLH